MWLVRGDGSRAAADQPATKAPRSPSRSRMRASCSTWRIPRHSKACATAQFYRLACRSACAARKSPPSRSVTCIRIVAMIRCASSARADGAMRLPSTRRRLGAYGHIWNAPGTARAWMARCFGRSSTKAGPIGCAGLWTRTRSIGWCASMRAPSALRAATPRTRCARLSSPRRSKTMLSNCT
jgi:hypothetical protein